ncbi:DUF4870 domain-containing protein [Paenarthrobacter aurescens]|nr:DUF4870 domain-containing protein [Paenarthrobacter aurescens]MDO6144535.1 DUF4870 domain-containing protein [Paenarthrobacter aurescens]MDO6148380.1 DUF4870 domain-containing protein [Paenarthrobacter aurescens]MDO6159626.1 DUF4870 domain-containing protein [Paenarthrobacter aurescens]MDO6164528.1 DUF4870 domain-containing protein [Paenarthrobacter aurescens]
MSAQPIQVSPRPGTSHHAELSPQAETTLAMFAHLSGLLGIVGPLVVFLVLQEKSQFARKQALEAINFHITVILAVPVGIAFVFAGNLFGSYQPITVIVAAALIFPIVAATNAGTGQFYRYPLAIRFIKI